MHSGSYMIQPLHRVFMCSEGDKEQRLLTYRAFTERTLYLRLSYIYCEIGSQFLSKSNVILVLQRHYILY